MDIVISWDSGKKSIQLPVNPSSFEISSSMNNSSVVINDLGEINLKGKRGLYEITLESFFPAQNYEFCQVKPKSPSYYIEKFKSLYEKNTTVKLVISDADIDLYCTIEQFTYGQSEKNGDYSYSMAFKEDRTPKNSDRISTKNSDKTYTWKKGDTWSKVVKKQTGSSKNWKTIRKNNKKVISKATKKNPKAKEEVALIGFKVVIK